MGTGVWFVGAWNQLTCCLKLNSDSSPDEWFKKISLHTSVLKTTIIRLEFTVCSAVKIMFQTFFILNSTGLT